MRLLSFLVHCSHNSRTTYYNVSLFPLYSSVLFSQVLRLTFAVHGICIKMYSSVFVKSLHNAYSYSGGWEILGEREILMQFFFKWKVDFQLFLFKGGKYPFDDEAKPFFLPRTPDFNLCPEGGGQKDYCAHNYKYEIDNNF